MVEPFRTTVTMGLTAVRVWLPPEQFGWDLDGWVTAKPHVLTCCCLQQTITSLQVDRGILRRRSRINVHPNFSEAPYLRSSMPHPKPDFGKIQIASR